MVPSEDMDKYWRTRHWADHQVARALNMSENLINRLQVERPPKVVNPQQEQRCQRRVDKEELRLVRRQLNQRRLDGKESNAVATINSKLQANSACKGINVLLNILVTMPTGKKCVIHALIAIPDYEVQRIVINGIEFRRDKQED